MVSAAAAASVSDQSRLNCWSAGLAVLTLRVLGTVSLKLMVTAIENRGSCWMVRAGVSVATRASATNGTATEGACSVVTSTTTALTIAIAFATLASARRALPFATASAIDNIGVVRIGTVAGTTTTTSAAALSSASILPAALLSSRLNCFPLILAAAPAARYVHPVSSLSFTAA